MSALTVRVQGEGRDIDFAHGETAKSKTWRTSEMGTQRALWAGPKTFAKLPAVNSAGICPVTKTDVSCPVTKPDAFKRLASIGQIIVPTSHLAVRLQKTTWGS